MTAEEVILKIDVRAAVEAAIEKEWFFIGFEDGCAHFDDRGYPYFYKRLYPLLHGQRGMVALPRDVLAARIEESVRADPARWLMPTSEDPLDYSKENEDTLMDQIALLLDWAHFALSRKKAK